MSGGDNLDFEIRPNPAPVADAERAALLANPGFGRIFTDHMVTIRYAEGKGWYEPRVEARAPIPMDPATAVLHYAQEIFEGLKAYTMPDGGVAMFRPDANAARFGQLGPADGDAAAAAGQRSSSRCAQIIAIDRQWIPQTEDGSLYLRPFAYASEVFLGVRPAMEYLYLVIASPVGSVLLRRRQAGRGVGHAGLHPGRARRHRRGQVRRQLRGRRCPPRPRPSSTAATRSSSSTRWSASTSTNWAA